MEWVASTLHTRNMVYPALLPLMRTPRLPVVDWTDVPADLNGLVRFSERRSLVSARVPSHFNWPLRTSPYRTSRNPQFLSGLRQDLVYQFFFLPSPMKQMTRGLQIPGTSSPWELFFLPWLLMFVHPQYGTCCMSPCWSLDFEAVCVFLETVYTPHYRQYGQNFLHSIRLTAWF